MDQREGSYFYYWQTLRQYLCFVILFSTSFQCLCYSFKAISQGKKALCKCGIQGSFVLHHLIRQHLGRFLEFFKTKSILLSPFLPGGESAVSLQRNISGYRLIVLLSVICISSVLSIFFILYDSFPVVFYAKHTWLAVSILKITQRDNKVYLLQWFFTLVLFVITKASKK